MAGETKESGLDEFVAAREQLEKLIGELRSESARILEHGEVESLISREGKELLRRLMQGRVTTRPKRRPQRCRVKAKSFRQQSRSAPFERWKILFLSAVIVTDDGLSSLIRLKP